RRRRHRAQELPRPHRDLRLARQGRARGERGQHCADAHGRVELRAPRRDVQREAEKDWLMSWERATPVAPPPSTTVHPRWTGPMPVESAFLPSPSAFPGLPPAEEKSSKTIMSVLVRWN